MRSVTHREMRNNSGDILRAVAAGESVQVTNDGQPAAVIVPPAGATIEDLVAQGQARAANRHPGDIDLSAVGVVLDTVTLVDLTRGDLLTAGALPGRLRSNDAIHLAVALRVGVDEMLTYGSELAAAAGASGLAVARPA
ncbi:type II toxin-antitoxin system prevent-host-death family antitoxin [Blastococcus capsensis]|uniref:type II toxin-antitoxin system prevent-host-death family antitoxin n=1 Tax=Blastococcus capsensis TaxID=1564163 RepID=UPI00253FAC51|nr:type II toxin-antitoxin system prevent-host-death family antitoxin [Blastococcus capsensis]MDK3257529.1 type II toxin-antitoxin system prevent-host-death family antitoxin [Blastococcus capsensis]